MVNRHKKPMMTIKAAVEMWSFMAKWFLRKNDVNIALMAQTLGVHPAVAVAMANRGIQTRKAALDFLYPKRESLGDVTGMKDMEKALQLTMEAIDDHRPISIYGDYDVDGVMSSSILCKGLRGLGANVSVYIPHREEEGYGMNMAAIRRLFEEGIDMIIACDNGIAATPEIQLAKDLGMRVVVIDHHEPAFTEDEQGVRQEVIPPADAVVDPKQADCPYPFKAMCAAGLCYRFIQALYGAKNLPNPGEDEYLILASIATVCDIVNLMGENRVLVKNALDLLNQGVCPNLGLRTLMQERQLMDKKLGTFDIGFIIGPCINASGRLETALSAVELFTTEEAGEATALARKLIELNDARKAITAEAVDKALLAMQEGELDKVIVYYDPEIHESVAGIVAGRIKDSICHPTIVLTDGMDCAKGSARSVEGYHIFEALLQCQDLFLRFGGHEMAAGLSLQKGNIPLLRQRLNEACILTESDFVPIIRIDQEVPLSAVTYELANELRLLEPFGKGNKEPIYGTKNVTADLVETIGENKKTLRFTFTIEETGRRLKAVCFNKMEQFMAMLEAAHGQRALQKFSYGRMMNLTLDILYTIDINEYNGNTYVDMKICDFRF